MKPVAYLLMLVGVLIGAFAIYNIYAASGGLLTVYLAIGGAVVAVVGMVLKTIADRGTAPKQP